MPVRIDIWLVQAGYFESREKARIALEEGVVSVNGSVVYKAASKVVGTDRIEVQGTSLPYVSRGGLKLEKAIRTFQLDFTDKMVLDIGASTGGFTDCALQHGAARVFAIDVGSEQLHPSLRNHPQVQWWEQLDIRSLHPEHLGVPVDIILVDLSFISLQAVFPLFAQFLQPHGALITLIKPQFELEERVRLKKGIVKDEKTRQQILDKIMDAAQAQGFQLQNLTATDADPRLKNVEFLAYWTRFASMPLSEKVPA
ncbi:MAG TPA: TlyA family RNA methyltransferase [Saprospiraceae bacterium]|nr:TlyA family RNA methyltransferase [Saprospiraceae bacterium]HMP23724.1 TlyA family RNA methyltransferase [Saprospiraceae bacterium]